MLKTPFKFLDSYTSDDKDIFFGREKEVEELYYKIFDGDLLIVYGSSGTGKTSLIQCGLAGKFEDADWMPVIIRRAGNINESIRKTLRNIAITPLKEKNTLAQDVQSIYLDYFKPVFLLFDQFEELFIFGSDKEIEQFVDSLKECLEAKQSCKFIFVIRGEYLEHISRFEDKIPEFFNNRMRIERMTRRNAERVITEPCKLFNIEVADGFPSKVLERLGHDKTASIELTYLQVYLDKLYKKAATKDPGHIVFDDSLLEESGRIDDVLSEFLDEQIARTENPEDALTILKSFVSNEGTKKQMSASDVSDFIKTLGKKLPGETIEKYLRQFVDLRILKDKDDNNKYELRHDSLAAKIFEQISYSEKEMLEVRQFIINRYNDYEKRGTHLQESDIQYILPYENKMFLNEEQKAFVEESIRSAKAKKNRRRNVFIVGATLLLVTLTGFSIFAMKQRDAALAQKRIAEQKTREALNQKELAEKAKDLSLKASQQALDAKSYAELQSNIAVEQKKLAQQQAMKAQEQSEIANQQKSIAEEQTAMATQEKNKADEEKEKAEKAQTEANRLRLLALSQNVAFKSLQLKNEPQLAALLSTEAYNLAQENGGNIQDAQLYASLYQSLKNFDPANYPNTIQGPAEILAMNTSPDGNTMVLYANGSIAYYTGDGAAPVKTVPVKGPVINTGYISSNGKYVLTAYEDNSAKVWNMANGGAGSPLMKGHTGLIRAAAFSADGSTLVTGGRDSLVLVWEDYKMTKKIKYPSRVRSVAISNNKKKILVGCEDGIVYENELGSSDRGILTSYTGARVQNVMYSSNGKYMITAASNGEMSIFSSAGKLLKNIAGSSSADHIVADDATGLLVEAAANRRVHIYDLNELSAKPIELADINSFIRDIALSPAGIVSVGMANNNIRQYSVKTPVIQKKLAGHIRRNMSADEWNTYVGKDVPYRKINTSLP